MPVDIPGSDGGEIEDDQLNYAIDYLLERTSYYPEIDPADSLNAAW
ncbi:MAG: hypothetical protein R3A46_05675 [Thermomicrobiales bacterium]